MHEVLGWAGPVTYRQYLAWHAWSNTQWNKPSRSDHYLMQVAQVVAQKFAKEPNSIKLNMFKIPFRFIMRKAKELGELTRQQKLQLSKAAWGAWTGAGKPPESKNDGN